LFLNFEQKRASCSHKIVLIKNKCINLLILIVSAQLFAFDSIVELPCTGNNINILSLLTATSSKLPRSCDHVCIGLDLL